jgi:sugar (pentulose or hexulose) kinase
MAACPLAQDGGPLLIGCDIGTSAVKAVLATATGVPVAQHATEHPMRRPRPGWAENDPDDWYRGVATAVRELLTDVAVSSRQIAAIGIVAQREPVVLLDASGTPLGPSISWTDRRTAAEAAEVSDRFGRTWLIQTTGMAPIPGATLTHLVWLQRHRAEEFAQTKRIVFAKDYVVERLTGVRGTDVSTPGRSLMLDIRSREYSAEICEAFDIDVATLPAICHRSWEPIGELQRGPAQQLGLSPGTMVATGGADDASAALGAGAIEPGELCVGSGTAASWRTVLDAPRSDLRGRGDVAPHVVPDRYIFEVAIESTGSSLRWLRETFGPDRTFEQLIEEAAPVAPGSDELMFFPYVDGANRAPHYLPDASGAFLGILSGHTRAHFVRALLEGISYQYPPTMAIVGSLARLRTPVVTGDAESSSKTWNQIKADVLGVPLCVPRIAQLAACGSAILAGVAAGVFADIPTGLRALVRPARTFEPDPARHAVYDELRTAYERAFELIASPALIRRRTHDHEYG